MRSDVASTLNDLVVQLLYRIAQIHLTFLSRLPELLNVLEQVLDRFFEIQKL